MEKIATGEKKPGDQRRRPERDWRSENRTDKKKGPKGKTEWKIIGAGVCVPVWGLCVWWIHPLFLGAIPEFPLALLGPDSCH